MVGTSGMAVHFATYEAAVLGFGSVEDLKKLRQQVIYIDCTFEFTTDDLSI